MSKLLAIAPEVVRISLEPKDLKAASLGPAEAVGEKPAHGWTYTAYAQFYGRVNDRLMFFFPGSAAKTIRERVPTGRVKIVDGHPWESEATRTLGKVLEAREEAQGKWYRGFLSEAHGDIAAKLADGTVDENSDEIHILDEEPIEVALEAVPVTARRWCEHTPDGMVIVRGVKEIYWKNVGLVTNSSQGDRALIEPPVMVPFQDLPVEANSSWAPKEQLERLSSWAGQDPARGRPNTTRLRLAHLVHLPSGRMLGQIARPDGEGLVVSLAALDVARRSLETDLAEVGLEKISISEILEAADRQAQLYRRKIESKPLTRSATFAISSAQAKAGAAPDPSADTTHPTPKATARSEAAERLRRLSAKVKLLGLDKKIVELGRSATHVSTGASRRTESGGPPALAGIAERAHDPSE